MRTLSTLLFALSVACSKGSSTSTSTPTPTPTPTATSTPTLTPTPTANAAPNAPTATVRLLSRGSEPVRTLRYAWHLDRKEVMHIELRTTVSMVGAKMRQDTALPALRVAVAIEPQAVTPEGDLRFAWHVLEAKADQDADGGTPQVAEAWRLQITPVEHLSGKAVVGADGLSKSVTLDATVDAAPDAEMVVQVVQMLRDYVAPFPAEPVGIGARWERVESLESKNGHATQTDTYTLKELHGDKGTLDDVVAQTAPPQTLAPPAGAAPGAEPAHVDSLLTSGTESLAFDLGRVVAQAKFDGTTAMSLSSQSQALRMVMQLGITVSGETR